MFDIKNVINRTLIYFPVFKIIINNIKFIENKSINTACTTGRVVYYNPEFFNSLTKDQQVFTIAHELMHITLKHLSRREERDMEIWNYATDAVINQLLVKNGLPMIEGLIDCPDALDYSAEEYYEMVKNRPDCDEIMAKYRQDKAKASGGNIASHDEWNKEEEEEITDEIPDINEHNISDVNKKLVHDDNTQFRQGIESQEPQKSVIDGVGESTPAIDWKTFLQRQKRKIVSADYDLHNGEFNEEGFYQYPIMHIKKSNIEILIDTSGSVDDELVKAFLKECKNIFDDFTIKIGCFDTRFYGFQEVKDKAELDNFKIEGRGGTDFEVAAKAFSKKAAVKIIFTDGYANVPKERQNIIWVVYGEVKFNPPGGTVFYVDPNTLTLKGKNR